MGALARHDYSSLAPNYDRSRRAEPAIVASLIAGCRQLGARTVLDLGAGTCNYTEELQRAGFQTIALDVSAPMLACGSEKRVASRVGADAELIPLKPASIDVAVCVNVLHHLSDVEMAFREARRVVTKGVVVQIVARENIGSLWYRRYF